MTCEVFSVSYMVQTFQASIFICALSHRRLILIFLVSTMELSLGEVIQLWFDSPVEPIIEVNIISFVVVSVTVIVFTGWGVANGVSPRLSHQPEGSGNS